MAPVPPHRFAALFRALDPAERAAFVARLWSARGWETSVEDGSVVAVRDGAEERISVVDPGRFGTPALGDADVVVATRDRAAVRDGAAAAGVTYLPPGRLRERLLYSLDRETAATLFAETFDRPLDAPVGTPISLSEGAWEAGSAASEAVRERIGSSRGLAVLLLIGLLVGVAVAGPALSPPETNTTVPSATFTPGEAGALGGSTATPATVGTSTDDDGRPAGLGERSITDRSALLDGHVAGVVGTSRTLELRASGPTNATFMRGRERWNYTARIQHSREYRFDGRFVFPATTFPSENDSSADVATVSIYADGETKYRRLRTPNGTTYRRYPIETTGDASGYATEIRTYLATYLQGDRSIVDCVGTLESGDCFAYRIVITGAPETFPDAESYRAVAVVQDDGIISSFRVSYTLPDSDGDGERELVQFAVEYEGFSETTVSEPDWLATAKDEID